MKPCDRTRELLLAQYKKYPQLEIGDVYKFIYQGVFGPGHMIRSKSTATELIEEEYNSAVFDSDGLTEELDGNFSRVSLSCIDGGIRPSTLGALFYLSASDERGTLEDLESKLAVVKDLATEGLLPFSVDEFESVAERLKSEGYPAVHHSDTFRQLYRPAYRVISKKYVPFLPLFAKIDALLAEKRTLTLAIDGGCAGGKTTLAKVLEKIYGAFVFHMDDFFLRPEQRTKERYSEVGGNVDRERFLSEVLLPIKSGLPINFRRFDCSTFTLLESETVTQSRFYVVEGSYSMHPELAPHYDLSVFLDVPLDERKKRIANRNSKFIAERFYNEWIPLEEKYFERMNVKERCDIRIEF